MIHFLPATFEQNEVVPGPYCEAVTRLSSIRQALASVEQFAGDEPTDTMAEAKLAAAWPVASPARKRSFDARSTRTAAGAAAGLEAIAGKGANPAAVKRLKRELTYGVESIDQLFSL